MIEETIHSREGTVQIRGFTLPFVVISLVLDAMLDIEPKSAQRMRSRSGAGSTTVRGVTRGYTTSCLIRLSPDTPREPYERQGHGYA